MSEEGFSGQNNCRTQGTALSQGTPFQSHILIVDDDVRLRNLLQRYLSENSFLVTVAGSAAEARQILQTLLPDIIVSDIMMPGEDGLSFIGFLRNERHSAVPVLLLTARGEPADRIIGLESGADDYLAKPFEPRELVLRVQALLRRVRLPAAEGKVIKLGAASFDVETGELSAPSGTVRLTQSESSLLAFLAARPGEIVSREDMALFLGLGEGSERAVDVQVTRLRRKIEEDPKEPRFLLTLRGKGYMLKPRATVKTE